MTLKNVVRALSAIVLIVVSAEFAAGLFYLIQTGRIFWMRESTSQATATAGQPAEAGAGQGLKAMLSPFFGVVMQPGSSYGAIPGSNFMWKQKGYASYPFYKDWGANNFGFVEGQDYPVEVGPNDFVVGVFGGSVANFLALDGRELIVQKLHDIPVLAQKHIVVLNFSGHATKQPQQSLILSYFVAIGQHFDLVINMDGFNEAYIGYDNLINQNIEPSMPLARWVYGVQNYFINAVAVGRIQAARAEFARLNERMQATHFALRYYFLRFRGASLVSEAVGIDNDLERPLPGRDYAVLLPNKSGVKFQDAIPSIVQTWAVSSIEMALTARLIGAAYLHILQPSPYFGARPFVEVQDGSIEKTAWPFPEIVPPVYLGFQKAGEALRGHGVAFVDATATFDRHLEPIYYDNISHFNLAAFRIFADDVLGPGLAKLQLPGADKP